MSANNYILIDRKNFEITERDADTGSVLRKIGKVKTLKEAIDLAQEHQDLVEYGISFVGK